MEYIFNGIYSVYNAVYAQASNFISCFAPDICIAIVIDITKYGVSYVTKKIYDSIKIILYNEKENTSINIDEDKYLVVANQIIMELGGYSNIKNINYNDCLHSNWKNRFKYNFISAELYDITSAKTDIIKELGYKIAEPVNNIEIFIIPCDETRDKMLKFFQLNIN